MLSFGLFFFCTLATAFPTSYRMKTVLLEHENSPMMHTQSTLYPLLLSQRRAIDCRRKSINGSVRKEAMGMRLMPTKTMVICYVIGNA